MKKLVGIICIVPVLLQTLMACGSYEHSSNARPVPPDDNVAPSQVEPIPEDPANNGVEPGTTSSLEQPSDIQPLVAEVSTFSVTQICKASIAALMGRDPSTIKVSLQENIAFLSYMRPDDGSEWSYRCKIEGERVIWAEGATGRWRDSSLDEQVIFAPIEGDRLEIEQRFGDGSSMKDTFDRSQLGN